MGSDDGFGKPQKGPLAPLLGKATKFWKQRSMPERVALAVATVLMVCPSSVVWSELQRTPSAGQQLFLGVTVSMWRVLTCADARLGDPATVHTPRTEPAPHEVVNP